jgi:hypothetical protein
MKQRIAPQEELKADISLNYSRLMEESQARDKRGQLIDVLARIFEQRMNTALESYHDICQFSGSTALELKQAA